MKNNVVCNAVEISCAYLKMEIYADYLTSLMERYIQILAAVQRDAICDDLISARLSALAEEVRPLITQIEQIINLESVQVSKQEIREIRAADNFSYPREPLERIPCMLSSFLS